ncbi:MAG: hypothetical protein LM517_01235 [Nitrosomonas sp.]|nr:hypothetical protein [Nitrosomonas sp.]
MNSIEIAKKIIESSGNSFHSQVAQWLKENGWHVLISPYYMDQSQNKAREIDLIAERSIPINGEFYPWIGDVVIRMYIECKYVSSHSVFWFTEKDKDSAVKLVCRSGGFRETNDFTFQHHYLSTSDAVAKLFATDTKSQEQDPFYKALNQVLNAFISMQTRPPIISAHYDQSKRIRLDYPVVICSDFDILFRTDFLRDSGPEKISENFQLEVQYAYTDKSNNPRDDYFLIDFVEYDQLKEFCEKLIRNGEVSAFLSR